MQSFPVLPKRSFTVSATPSKSDRSIKLSFCNFFLQILQKSEVFVVPTPCFGEGIVDVNVVGLNGKLLGKDAADFGGHLFGDGSFGRAEELNLHHCDGKRIVAAKPHPAVVLKRSISQYSLFPGNKEMALPSFSLIFASFSGVRRIFSFVSINGIAGNLLW